jgi:hypothetical protein
LTRHDSRLFTSLSNRGFSIVQKAGSTFITKSSLEFQNRKQSFDKAYPKIGKEILGVKFNPGG